MNMVLEVIHITLLTIAKSVFNISYVIVVCIIYLLIKRNNKINLYNMDNSKGIISELLEVTLQGILVGIVGSIVIILLGLPVNLSIYLVLLLPISLILSLINIRYICFSYSAAIMGLLALIFNGQMLFGITLPNIDINIAGLIALVGVLHLMESILIYFVGADDCIPIVSKKNNKIVFGHILQKYWPLPLAILYLTIKPASGNLIEMPSWWPLLKDSNSMGIVYYGLISIVGALGYSSITFVEQPQKRAKKTALMLFAYSCCIIMFSIIIKDNILLNIIGLILMATMHEAIIIIEQRNEINKSPIYDLPAKGIRIMDTYRGSVAEKMGIKKGDIIKKINNIEVINIKHFKEIMRNRFTFIWVETMTIENETVIYEYKAYPNGLENLGVKILPEDPKILFKYDNIKNIGMIHILKSKYKKK